MSQTELLGIVSLSVRNKVTNYHVNKLKRGLERFDYHNCCRLVHRRRSHDTMGHVLHTFTNGWACWHREQKNSKIEIAEYFLPWWAKTAIPIEAGLLYKLRSFESLLYLLNIWEFAYLVWGLSPPKRRVVRRRNFARRRVRSIPTICRTCVGWGRWKSGSGKRGSWMCKLVGPLEFTW